jgi:hypothetical protein
MKVKIKNATQKQKWQAKEIAKAVLAMGEEKGLFPNPDFSVTITFEEIESGEDEALGLTYAPIIPNSYMIAIDRNIDKEDMGWCIAHELIHVYQIYCGYMGVAMAGACFAWKGKVVTTEEYEKNYDEDPSEVMAWGQQDTVVKLAEKLWSKQYTVV